MDLVSSLIFHNISIHLEFNQAIKVINNCVPHHQAIIASLTMMAWGNTSKELSELVWVVIHHLRLDLLPAMEVWAVVVNVDRHCGCPNDSMQQPLVNGDRSQC